MTSITNFGFKIKKGVNYFSNLSTNNSRELFFHFLWKKNLRPTYYFSGFDDGEKDIKNIDHISFHNDGSIHMKYLEDKKPYKNIKTIKIPKLPTSQEILGSSCYMPLAAISIYDSEKLFDFVGNENPLAFKEGSNINLFWELEDTNKFSLVLFLVGSSVNYKKLLEDKFGGIFNVSASRLFMNYFGDENKVKLNELGEVTEINDIGLLVGFTKKVIPFPSPSHLLGPKKKKQKTEIILDCYGLKILPTEESINSFID